MINHPELAGSYPDLPALLSAVAESRAFAECFARHWLAFFLERPPSETDPIWVGELADSIASGASLRSVVERTSLTLFERSRDVEPWCSGS